MEMNTININEKDSQEEMNNLLMSLGLSESLFDEIEVVETPDIAKVEVKDIDAVVASVEDAIEEETKLAVEAKKASKKPRKPRDSFKGMSKEEILKAKLGSNIDQYLYLESDYTEKTEEEKQQIRAETLDMFKEGLEHAPKKVQDRMTYFVEYVSGLRNDLNAFQTKAIELLVKDGCIDAKKDGHYVTEMKRMPSGNGFYGIGTVNSCTQSSLKAMKMLKIVVQNSFGKWVINPKSTYLPMLKAKMNL